MEFFTAHVKQVLKDPRVPLALPDLTVIRVWKDNLDRGATLAPRVSLLRALLVSKKTTDSRSRHATEWFICVVSVGHK
jgi:hypothetical protein